MSCLFERCLNFGFMRRGSFWKGGFLFIGVSGGGDWDLEDDNNDEDVKVRASG